MVSCTITSNARSGRWRLWATPHTRNPAEADAPLEWKQGGEAYGKRVASMVAWSGIHSALAFGLDSTLHQDRGTFDRAAAASGAGRDMRCVEPS